MIPLAFAHGFSAYITFWFVLIAFLWFLEEKRRKKNEDWTVVRDHLYMCRKCHLTFLAKHDTGHITRCPRCNELCFIHEHKRF